MNFSQHPDDAEDYCHGTVQQEAHKEMVQLRGMARPYAEWVLTDFDVWEKNPYFTGVPSGRHPEDDRDEEPVKNVLHFGQVKHVSALEAGEPSDSGNGYYSYSYYTLPYTGQVTTGEDGNIGKVASILHKRHYNYPFTSLGTVKVLNQSETGGTILYSVTYHHGD